MPASLNEIGQTLQFLLDTPQRFEQWVKKQKTIALPEGKHPVEWYLQERHHLHIEIREERFIFFRTPDDNDPTFWVTPMWLYRFTWLWEDATQAKGEVKDIILFSLAYAMGREWNFLTQRFDSPPKRLPCDICHGLSLLSTTSTVHYGDDAIWVCLTCAPGCVPMIEERVQEYMRAREQLKDLRTRSINQEWSI